MGAYGGVWGHIVVYRMVVYFNKLFLLSGVILQTGHTSEYQFCGIIEAFVLDL